MKVSDNISCPLEIFCDLRAHLVCIGNGEGLHSSIFMEDEEKYNIDRGLLNLFSSLGILGHLIKFFKSIK